MTEPSWQNALYDQLRAQGVRIFTYVPDAGHRVLIDRSIADPAAVSVALTTEEEGVGIAAGAHLGGERAALVTTAKRVINARTQVWALISRRWLRARASSTPVPFRRPKK
ncbi:MAG: hypothetical protein HOI95_03305 [Chromatiales bacterium]|nr:hypothetical protein [Chromatiales bacterium]